MRDLPRPYSQSEPPATLREHVERLSERIIQAIWHHLFLTLDNLQTTDGRPVRILDRGQWNQDAGPDFRAVKVRIGDEVLHGDVEIHWRTSDWIAHGHEDDPKYARVILHGVYEDDRTPTGRQVPILELKPHLSSSLGQLAERLRWMGINDEALLCRDFIARLDPSFVRKYIEHKGAERLEYKVRRFAELKASHRLSWNEVFYFGIMDALGFSKNREPFRRLASAVRYRDLMAAIRDDEPTTALMRLQAILLGAAGLLAIDPRKVRGDIGVIPYVQRLESLWSEFRASRPGGAWMSMPEWRLFRLRPSNFPTLRIAGLCRLLQAHAGRSWPDVWAKALSTESAVESWLSLLTVPAYGYWSDHYWWGDEGRHRQKDLIGRQRAFEIVVNVVLPLLKLWSEEKGRPNLSLDVHRIAESAASREKNSVIRFMQSQLATGGEATIRFHQGLIHLHRQCRSYGCADCPIFERIIESSGQDG